MTWTVPGDWILVSRPDFDRVVDEQPSRRTGWGGAIVYHDAWTRLKIGAILDKAGECDGAGDCYVHPLLAARVLGRHA